MFGGQAGFQVSFVPEIAAGKRSRGVQGTMTAHAALARVLAGTGLSYHFANARTVTIDAPAAAQTTNAQDGVALPAIDIEGESAFGPVKGYVAQHSATGTKTDAPLIETPQSISVVPRDQLDAQQSTSTKEALRYTAGVAAENRANFGSTDITYSRGFILNRFLDGMKLQGDAAFVAPQPELYGIERVEVLRGPASVLYGQSSLGGIINLVSKRPTAQPFGEIELQGGSYDRFQGAFDFGGPADKDGKFLYRLTGLVRDADNQVDFVKDQRTFIAPSFTWRPDNDTSLTVLASYQRDPKAGLYNFVPYAGSVAPNPNGSIPTSFYGGDPGYNQINRTQASIGYAFEHKFDSVWTVRQNMRYLNMNGDLNQVLPLVLLPDNRTLMRYAQATHDNISTFSLDNQAQADFATGPLQHKVLLGIDYEHTLFTEALAQDLAPDLDVFNPTYYQAFTPPSLGNPGVATQTEQRQRQLGVYLQDQIKLDRLTLLLSGRSDQVNTDNINQFTGINTPQDDHAFTKRIGAVYQFDSGFAPYVSYATSFTPTLGTDAAGQPFKPTTGTLYEAGIKFQPKGYNGFLQASVFQLTQQNVVSSDPAGFGARIQVGEIRSRGIELEGKLSLTDQLDVIGTYAYVNPEVTSSPYADLGKMPVNVPRQLASAWADYTLRDGPFNGLGFGAGVRYTGETYADQINTISVPAFTVVDAAVHYDLVNLDQKLKGVRLSVNATNIFDQVYASQCTYTDAFGPNTNCVYGLRRQVVGTLRYRW